MNSLSLPPLLDQSALSFLEKELNDAVAKQNYRKAARIRKQLDELGGDEAK